MCAYLLITNEKISYTGFRKCYLAEFMNKIGICAGLSQDIKGVIFTVVFYVREIIP